MLITPNRSLEAAQNSPDPIFADHRPWPWKLAVGDVDREPVIVILKRGADAWTPYSTIRFDVIGQRIERIVDYIHCPWVIEAATVVHAYDQP